MKLGRLKPEKLKKKKEIKNYKKRNLLKLFALLLFLAILLGFFLITRGILGDRESSAEKTEAAREDQSRIQEKQSKTRDNNDSAEIGNFENHLGSNFIKTLMSGEYLIKYKTTTVYNGQSYEVETTYAVSGSDIAMISGDRASIVKDNRAYMLNHTDKTLISWDVTNSVNLKKIDTEGLYYVSSGEENGYHFEKYATAQSDMTLYFDGKELIRMDTKINGQDVIIDIIEVSSEVESSLFEIPSDYQETNL